ncbi:hypothetical protein CP965_05695 [Halarcobacter mediterraneus]|uniref:Uncharacterized protein n=1 Tax=Halarcobacter mediterraneus TaxID=2023153 RepID=A0A4Q1B3A4_9BACT|nr:hypothetical protein [Halarcobacter mediterraneus]RXK13295.1 hypothetical protein CP965_05695 [Halarcobacter mediterraneus]
MKDLTKYYLDKEILFKEIEEVSPKELKSRKKIKIYVATATNRDYYAIFIVDSKSRFIRKNAEDLMLLESQLSQYKEHNFKKKELLISSALCSKAKKLLEDNKWRVRVDFM